MHMVDLYDILISNWSHLGSSLYILCRIVFAHAVSCFLFDLYCYLKFTYFVHLVEDFQEDRYKGTVL